MLLKLYSPANFLKRFLHNEFQDIVVFGSGLMGSGIAQVSATAGYNVTLVDQSKEILQISKDRIQNSLNKVATKKFPSEKAKAHNFVNTTLQKLAFYDNPVQALKKCDLVIEAIAENLEIKQKLFASIDRILPKHTILTTNTSSLSIKEIASATTREDQFAGLHFFNPVPMMKLVEIIATSKTSEATSQKLVKYIKSIGKEPVKCQDTPGFIVNRLLIPYLVQAVQMYERGEATKEDIDTAMKLGAGYPMGPFELLDFIGLDTTHFILDGWKKKYPENKLFTMSSTIEKLVKDKKFGKKSGRGFYEYNK